MTDPVDEMREVIRETLRANALELVGAATHGEPVISEHALDELARGLLARRVAEPSRVLAGVGVPADPAGLHHHDVPGIGALWFDNVTGKVVGGPADD